MRFTCLIINFLSALPLNEDQCWRGGRGRDGECKERELKAECPLGIQAVPCQIQKQASLSRLSLCSYFIPFVWGTWWTGLQRRLQWAHQSTPTDCGPADALEMGINFFVENIETAYTKWGKWNQLLIFLLLFFLLFDCVSGSFLSQGSLWVRVAESSQTGNLFLSDARLARFSSFFLSSFLTFFRSLTLPSHWLFWQALVQFSPHGSGRKSMPICVFSCSTLDWWRLQERKTDEQNPETLRESTDYRKKKKIYQTVHLFTGIMQE